MQLPQMIRVKQTFESPRVSSIPDEVASQLGSLSLDQSIQPGQTVAISAGSRRFPRGYWACHERRGGRVAIRRRRGRK